MIYDHHIVFDGQPVVTTEAWAFLMLASVEERQGGTTGSDGGGSSVLQRLYARGR